MSKSNNPAVPTGLAALFGGRARESMDAEAERPGAITTTLAIGERIHARRKELGLTLQLLADISGLSASLISQAERNKTTPSVASLLALSRALGVSVDYFMQIPTTPNPIRRAADRSRARTLDGVTLLELKSELSLRQDMDALLLEIEPRGQAPLRQHDGEDFLFVVSGEIRIELGAQTDSMSTGDSVHFDARIPHSVSNVSETRAVVLYVGTPGFRREDSADES